MKSEENKKKIIPVHHLPEDRSQGFDFKLYHLKGEYAYNKKLTSMPGETSVPHRHKFYEVCFFTKGGGVHEIDFQSYEIKQRSIHFISPGQVHRIAGKAENQGFVLAFTGSFLLENDQYLPVGLNSLDFFNPVQGNQILQLDIDEYRSILQLVEGIEVDQHEMGDYARDIVRSYIMIILNKCKHYYSLLRLDDSQPEGSVLKLVEKFKNNVDQHFRTMHQVQEYSQLLNITPGHLNRCCKKLTGLNASELVLHRIVLEAKRLLIFTEKTSKEVAFELSFEDPSYFSRIFKKKTGFSPTSFRNRMRDKYHH